MTFVNSSIPTIEFNFGYLADPGSAELALESYTGHGLRSFIGCLYTILYTTFLALRLNC